MAGLHGGDGAVAGSVLEDRTGTYRQVAVIPCWGSDRMVCFQFVRRPARVSPIRVEPSVAVARFTFGTARARRNFEAYGLSSVPLAYTLGLQEKSAR
jgi:hypothetical protein